MMRFHSNRSLVQSPLRIGSLDAKMFLRSNTLLRVVL